MDPAERLERGLRRALDTPRVGDIADGAADVGRYLPQALTAACSASVSISASITFMPA
jgi:hypothetical protein